MKNYIIGGLVILGAVLASVLFKYFLHKEPNKKIKEENKNIIKQPAMYLWAGVAGIVLFGFFVILIILNHFNIISISEKESIYALPLFVPFILTGVYIILLGSVWKIEIYEDSFMHCNSFGKKNIYKFDDVKVVAKSATYWVYHNDKKKFSISYLQSNFDALQKAVYNYNKMKKESKKRKAKEK